MYYPVSALLIEFLILSVVESQDPTDMRSARPSRSWLILKNPLYIPS